MKVTGSGGSGGRVARWAAELLSTRRALPCLAVSMLLLMLMLMLTSAALGWQLGEKRALGRVLQEARKVGPLALLCQTSQPSHAHVEHQNSCHAPRALCFFNPCAGPGPVCPGQRLWPGHTMPKPTHLRHCRCRGRTLLCGASLRKQAVRPVPQQSSAW